MGWEWRGNSGPYYTRSRKVGGRVVREYVGGGLAGTLAELEDTRAREAREAERQAFRVERERLQQAEAAARPFCALVGALTRAALLAAGYHQHHRGEWRRRREREQDGMAAAHGG